MQDQFSKPPGVRRHRGGLKFQFKFRCFICIELSNERQLWSFHLASGA